MYMMWSVKSIDWFVDCKKYSLSGSKIVFVLFLQYGRPIDTSDLVVLRSSIFWTLVLIEISSTSYFGFEPSSSAMAPALLSLFNYLSAENHLFITFFSLSLVPSSYEWHYFWCWVGCCQTFYCPSFFYNISQQQCQPFLQGACCARWSERRN